MSRKQSVVIFTLCLAVLIALGMLIHVFSTSAPGPVTGTENSPAQNSVAPVGVTSSPAMAGQTAAVPPSRSLQPELAPWDRKYDAPTGSPRISTVASKAKAYETLQAKLVTLSAGGNTPKAKDLDAILAELQQINGSSEVGGVNLGALRNNLARAEEIQRLGDQMQAISQAPGKQDLPKIQRLMAEIQQQQAGLVMDIRAKSEFR